MAMSDDVMSNDQEQRGDHAYQGIGGILTTGLIGLTFGLLYLVARRNLWPTIIGHGLVNTFGITVLHLQATGAINTSGLG